MIRARVKIRKTQAKPDSAELAQFIEDLNNEDPSELKQWLRYSYMHLQLSRFNREELKLIVGHIGYLIDKTK